MSLGEDVRLDKRGRVWTVRSRAVSNNVLNGRQQASLPVEVGTQDYGAKFYWENKT